MREAERDALSALSQAREHLARGEAREALAALRGRITPDDAVHVQAQYARIARECAARLPDLSRIRIAFSAKATLDPLVDCMRYWLLQEGIRLQPFIIPFGTGRQQIIDPSSPLRAFRPEAVWLFSHREDLGWDPGLMAEAEVGEAMVQAALDEIRADAHAVAERFGAWVIVNNMPAPAARVFGNFESSGAATLAALLEKYNTGLPRALPPGGTVFDLAHVAAVYGLGRWEDERLWCHSKHPFAPGANGHVAFAAAKVVAAARGGAKKCLIIDLDNTIWGGVVGDDGIDGIVLGVDAGARGEAFARFQRWLKALAGRGIAIAVSSKNDPAVAREAFLKHPGMVLSLDDVASFRANWDSKADNIRAIASELNLGLDSLVFVDDNPAERALVREQLPQVVVPELPEDPAGFIAALNAGRWFEAIAVSREDRARTASYRDNALRAELRSSATDLAGYLRALDMRARWGVVDDRTLQRVVQLINKTNQFHLTTTRYTTQDLVRMVESENYWVGQFALADRFGDNGIIAAAVLRFEGPTAHVDTWTMSCRVFSRTMEQFTFARLARVARARGCTELVGTYRPTAKNRVVADLYASLGGMRRASSEEGEEWVFPLPDDFPELSEFIEDASSSASVSIPTTK